ncbi:MAG: DegT/DnrJ/EryC1/StrS family aminotransferase [Dysgonamonadaceae bacterium]|jgi:dTDP-4-amino-4,6-dideoxygalactose transaminase|nr:DegT/DnrJ/EryC1/StrS family aminotransferase [Dysgonamonadaceae bacterium]
MNTTPNNIQMVDLTTQYARLQPEIDRAIAGVLRSGQYINGDAVREFTGNLAKYTGAKFAIPCANGTDALQIALMSLQLQPGDEVIVPAFTYIAAVEAIAILNLRPVLVDVDEKTFNIDVSKIEKAISPRTRAIIPVHLFGQTCDMEPVMQLAEKYRLFVIEDNAQSLGSIYTFSDGTQKQAGTIGHIGTLSFFPTKNLGCYGDGGAMLTDDETLAKRLKMIASHGQAQKYRHEIIGCNSRLDTIQAAVLNVKLQHLDEFIAARQMAVSSYLSKLESIKWIETPACIPSSTHAYNQFTVKIKNDELKINNYELQQYLKANNIPAMIYYPLPVHQQPAYQSIVRIGSDLGISEKLCNSVLSLPMHTELTEEECNYIAEKVVDKI